jgi:hypothetical protein
VFLLRVYDAFIFILNSKFCSDCQIFITVMWMVSYITTLIKFFLKFAAVYNRKFTSTWTFKGRISDEQLVLWRYWNKEDYSVLDMEFK